MKTTQSVTMMALLAVAASVALLAAGCSGSAHDEPATQSGDPAAQKSVKVVQYTCSMHPEIVQDKPGDCPKCGMKLVEKH
jgi:ABC-type glycerol-3-phosphate transport system substrate-binding protein